MSRKVVMIESAHEMGGVEFSTLYLASHLDPGVWEAVVVCPGEGSLSTACRESGVRVVIVPMPSLRSTSFRVGWGDFRLPNPISWVWNAFAVLQAAGRLRAFLARERPGLVLTKGMYAHVCGALAARRSGIQCVWHVQDLISERHGGLYRKVFGWLAQVLPDGIVVDGTPIARQLPHSLRNKVEVVFNGVDAQVFHPGLDGRALRDELGITPEQLVIGHAARLTPWKGQHHLLEAFGRLARLHPQARLLLAGSPLFDNDAYEKRLLARADEMGLSDRVLFAGFREDLPRVLAGMDVFAYPSVEKDTSPLSLISAMACGLPVVAFDLEGVREVLGDAGLLMPVGDVPGMASALTSLLQNHNQRKELGERARARFLAHFTLGRYLSGMEKVLERHGMS